MPHAALWVVQLLMLQKENERLRVSMPHAALLVVQQQYDQIGNSLPFGVSMPHAALLVVQRRSFDGCDRKFTSFNAARGFVGGAAQKGRS